MRYSLSDYIMSITIDDSIISNQLNVREISVGGEQSYLGLIEVNVPNSIYSTEGDNTGSWVHNKTLNKTGTVSLSINQLSPQIKTFITICNIYYKHANNTGMTITIKDRGNNIITTANDCYIQGIPRQSLGATASMQSWVFTCGEIIFG